MKIKKDNWIKLFDIDVLLSKKNKIYLAVNNYKKGTTTSSSEDVAEEEINPDNIPF